MDDIPDDLTALKVTELILLDREAEALLGKHIRRVARKDQAFRKALKDALRVEEALESRGVRL